MAFDVGDTVPLAADIADAAGAPTAASSVVLTVELPDGTTVTPEVSSPSTGRYVCDFVTTQAGRHAFHWNSTAPSSAFADVFDVRPGLPRYIISLADAKAHLNITSTRHDEELRAHIEAATDAIETYLGEVVVRRPVTEWVTLRNENRIALSHWPVIAVTAATGSSGVLDVSGWTVEDTGLVNLPTRMSGALTVTYTAGRSIIPAGYIAAAKMVVECLYGPQRNPGAGPPGRPGGEEVETIDPYGVVMSPKVRELLGVTGPAVA